jgi:hypothetical protein
MRLCIRSTLLCGNRALRRSRMHKEYRLPMEAGTYESYGHPYNPSAVYSRASQRRRRPKIMLAKWAFCDVAGHLFARRVASRKVRAR